MTTTEPATSDRPTHVYIVQEAETGRVVNASYDPKRAAKIAREINEGQ